MQIESQREIEKPWVICYYLLNLSIGKVVEDFGKSLYVKCFEKQEPDMLNAGWIKRRFDSPIKAMAYFKLKHKYYTKEETINFFLTKFPDERKNIESLLHSQSQPKCT